MYSVNSLAKRLFFILVSSYAVVTADVSTIGTSRFLEVSTMEKVQEYVFESLKTYSPKDLLVVFDIDSTLIMSEEPAIQMQNIKKYRDALKSYLKGIDDNEYAMLMNLCTHYPSRLVDVDAPKIIKNLQERRIKTIACTAASPGKIHGIERSEINRFETLKSHSIDFGQAFPDYPDASLTNVKGFLGRHPVFYQGVICSAATKSNPGKGASIVEFLRLTKFLPKLILFIDDNKQFLDDMKKVLQKEFPEIHFIGIEFTGEMNQPAKEISEAQFIQFWKNLRNEAQEGPKFLS